MQGLIAGLFIVLAALFMIRHVRRAAAGRGGCGCGCGASSCGTRDDGRRVGVPGLSCSGACGGCQGGKPGS